MMAPVLVSATRRRFPGFAALSAVASLAPLPLGAQTQGGAHRDLRQLEGRLSLSEIIAPARHEQNLHACRYENCQSTR
jgi:hypothetical protein